MLNLNDPFFFIHINLYISMHGTIALMKFMINMQPLDGDLSKLQLEVDELQKQQQQWQEKEEELLKKEKVLQFHPFISHSSLPVIDKLFGIIHYRL